MGQDTFANNGVYVIIKFNFENLELIKKMMTEDISIYYRTDPDGNCDEIHDIEALDEYNKIFIKKPITNEKFDTLRQENPDLPEELICLIKVFETYARNISRRENPHIFNECELSFNQMMKKYKEARKTFIDLGFLKKEIKCGFVFIDSY